MIDRETARETLRQYEAAKRRQSFPVDLSAERASRNGHLAAEDTGGLLDHLAAFVRRFVVLSRAQGAVVALWTLHTHALEAADSTPYIAITSAEKRSGKTRLLEVLAELVARPLSTANISEAALFRSIAQDAPTLLFDEIDAIFGVKARDREDLRGLVNAGHRRGASVRRVGGANRDKLEAFPVFCPKALAGIGQLPDTVADRAIPIRLERRAPDERVERGRLRRIKLESEPLRERAERWAAEETVDRLRHAEPELPEQLDDRAQDGAEPLLAIADLAGGDWPVRARRAFVELHGAPAPDEDSLGVRLLSDLRAVFGTRDRMTSADLATALDGLEEAPWADLWGRELDARGLARRLRPYGIAPHSIQFESGKARGYRREQFEDAWKRYLPLTRTVERSTVLHTSTEPRTADSEAFQDESRNAHESAANLHGKRVRNGGTDRGPDRGAAA